MKIAMVNKETNTVDNVIVWNGESAWDGGPAYTLIPVDGVYVGPGFTYDPNTQTFTAPVTLDQQP
jgi:hypothetical protein